MPSLTDNQTWTLKTHPRSRRGQTAIIALLVLLLLAFVGALFITIVAGNLKSQGRAHRTLNADYYAQAGLRYADDQLTHSLNGADWRPTLQYRLADNTAATNSAGTYPNGQDPLTLIVGPTNTRSRVEYQNYLTAHTGFGLPNPNDPDYQYLVQGFTRYNTEGGRFLLRVSYAPVASNTADPSARYLKIESVGREGVINPVDPTTYTNQPASKLAATEVAYKPIGITDYARFETNLDNRSSVMNLGVPSEYAGGTSTNAPAGIITPGVLDFNLPSGGTLNTTTPLLPYPVITTYGEPNAYMENTKTGQITAAINPLPAGYTTVNGGGSIRSNGPVRFYGVNNVILNRAPGSSVLDDIEVAGNLLLDSYDPNAALDNSQADTTTTPATGQQSALIVNPPTTGNPPLSAYVSPSNGLDTTTGKGQAFSTLGGAVRDGGTGSNSSDAAGNPRSIARLAPPVIDAVNSATSLTRYQDLTENSAPRLYPNTSGNVAADSLATDPNAGQDGWGQAIYVNNLSDQQHESSSLVGGHTLVDEWLNQGLGAQPVTNAKNGWDGPFYNPPGVDVTFGLQEQNLGTNIAPDPHSFYGVRLTRSDADSNGNPVLWKNEDGSQGNSPTMVVSYYDLHASNDPDNLAANAANPNNDVVIYCEGNVRIKPSMLSAPANEVVTGAPRLYPANGGGSSNSDDILPRHITLITNGTAYIEGSILKGNPDSSLTILAKNYVCINTTQFYSGALADQNPQSTQPPSASIADNSLLDFGAQNDVLVQDLILPPTTFPEYNLYISGGPSAPGETIADYDLVNPITGLSIGNGGTNLPFTPPLLQETFNTLGVNGGPSSLTHITFNLNLNNDLLPYLGQSLQLWTRRDPSTALVGSGVNVATQDYEQERSAVLPMDITIQAVLYAQDKSFFVIPGPWFNSDSSDNLYNYAYSHKADNGAAIPAGLRYGVAPSQLTVDTARFPFYGQPVDLRITIDGAVSENRPADISAQAAWMAKWGWIPQYHGGQATGNQNGNTTNGFEWAGHNPGGTANQPTTGLTLVYDPEAGYPYDPTGAGAIQQTASAALGYYLRTDVFGRPLPFTPDLPVSTGLLYAGQGDPQTTLQ